MTHLSHLLDRQNTLGATDEGQAVEALVSGTDGRIRSVHKYHTLLRHTVKNLLEHIAGLTSDLAPPTLFSQQQFGIDKQISSLFVTPAEMQLLFSRDRDLQQFFKEHDAEEQPEVFTLLSVTKQELDGFGCELQNDQIIRDVPRTTLNFTGHQIVTACSTQEQLLEMLRKLLFESTVDYLKAHLAKQKLAYHKKADQEARIPAAMENLNNPAVYLQALLQLLEEPLDLLKVEHKLLHVDRLGIMESKDTTAPDNELELDELTVGNWNNRAIFLARFPRSEFLTREQLAKEFNTLIF